MVPTVLNPTEEPEVQFWLFLRNLQASQLLPPDDIKLIEVQTGPKQLRDLERMLIDQRILTRYQLDRIKSGRGQGLVVGPYKILDELGQGGFGRVYKAMHAVMNRVVALKVVQPDIYKDRTRELFRREAVAASRLNHPNIALVYDANEIDGALILAMEFIEGSTLQAVVEQNGPLDPRLASAIALEIAHALQHAHENGLVHRDLKPANVMIMECDRKSSSGEGGSFRVKVVDFGLARVNAQGDNEIATILCDEGDLVGTPAYMSPEQARSAHNTDIRSDLYSLGCTMYTALSARLPFEGKSPRQILAQHSRGPVPLRNVAPTVPQELAAIVHRLMAKNPGDRYQTPTELVDALNAFLLSGGLCQKPAAKSPAAPAAVSTATQDVTSHVTMIEPVAELEVVAEDPVDIETVHRMWTDWCGVVDKLARGSDPLMSDAEYRVLYRSLLRAVRGSPALTAAHASRLESAVEPWVSMSAVEQLDPRTLAGLTRTYRNLTAAVWPVPARFKRRVWVLPVLCGLAGLIAFSAVMIGYRWVLTKDLFATWPYFLALVVAGIAATTVTLFVPSASRAIASSVAPARAPAPPLVR